MVFRIFVEKKKEFENASSIIKEIRSVLGISPSALRLFLRYDIEGIGEETLKTATNSIFSEPTVDRCYDDISDITNDTTLITEYAEGQYDQRADSAMQCIQLLTGGVRPLVKCAKVYVFYGITADELTKIKGYLINPVDSREGDEKMPVSLKRATAETGKMRVELSDFISYDRASLKSFYDGFGFAMAFSDIEFVQRYFKKLDRNPTLTEIKVIDTYWSDHCRHTTFLTEIKSIRIESENPRIGEALEAYRELFNELYADRKDKYPCLMDMATIAVKKLKKEGKLNNLDVSDEINACSVSVTVDVECDGRTFEEEWLIMFKNETHNHPTEIEPFGGAATCLGGAIRDPLSGRTYVYQAMRVTGCGNPLEPFSATLKGKLPQRVLTKTALSGFSSYGNQIGLATGIVAELYNDRYKAKRLETGYVIGGAPRENVVRKKPKSGDIVLLIGGDTGRDGCGGATGSSKSHTVKSVELCGAEVQKGNAPEERKLQRLFRNPEAARLIIKCNDFGAGGVCVAIGELSEGIDIFLDRVSKKYDGLSATELAISESQERMAVVVEAENTKRFSEICREENLKVAEVGVITNRAKLSMYYKNEEIVDIDRSFLDTNGVKQVVDAVIKEDVTDFFTSVSAETAELIKEGKTEEAVGKELSRLQNCSQKGAGENFDSTIGAASVLMPFGGLTQLTPSTVMASKPPVKGRTSAVTCSSFACYPELLISSPFIGSVYSVVSAVNKLIASGVKKETVRLSLQEFFKRLGGDPYRWGEPLGALLGALQAQLNLGVGAIGGKDSMSGSFENIDVPPTVIAFAMGITKENNVVHNVFSDKGRVYLYRVEKDEYGYPDFCKLNEMLTKIGAFIEEGKILNTAVVENGGRITALCKSCLGNGVGLALASPLSEKDFYPTVGDIIAVSNEKLDGKYLGELNDSGRITASNLNIGVSELEKAFTGTLEKVFPTTAPAEGEIVAASCVTNVIYKSKFAVAKPRVFIPVFPGTNCEYDMANAFERAGARAEIFVVKNLSGRAIEESVETMKKLIDASQIIAFPGGFSGGDEPDGSGKFIATAFRNPLLKESVEKLLYERDGLALGICNGFQALIKLGLLPYGRIRTQKESSPTLTYNNIRRHVSTMVNVRVGSNASPWLSDCEVGGLYSVPVSHGEGKFICDRDNFEKMLKSGQIATQYVDKNGSVTMLSPENPNGANYAVEGIISPDGRIFGKMGHTERYLPGLYKNLSLMPNMPIFESGIKYFR